MKFLRLSSNQLTGGPVAGMTNLTFLSLRDNSIKGPAPDLSAMKHLTDLYLDCNHYSGSLPTIYGTMKFSVRSRIGY
jgi:Leucine-rich repeat (LRR) protein